MNCWCNYFAATSPRFYGQRYSHFCLANHSLSLWIEACPQSSRMWSRSRFRTCDWHINWWRNLQKTCTMASARLCCCHQKVIWPIQRPLYLRGVHARLGALFCWSTRARPLCLRLKYMRAFLPADSWLILHQMWVQLSFWSTSWSSCSSCSVHLLGPPGLTGGVLRPLTAHTLGISQGKV